MHALILMIGLCIGLSAWPAGATESPLVLGVFPRHNYTETQEMFRPLAKHLSQVLGREVRLETTRDSESFLAGVSARRYDIIHLNQFQYFQAHSDTGYKVILKNEEFGESALSSVIVVRADSGITSLPQLKGKHIMFGGDRTASMSYLLPRDMLGAAGLASGSYREDFALNPPNALMAVFLRRADACGVGEAALRQKEVAKEVSLGELKVIARSAPVPHLPWAVRGDLEPGLRMRIQQTLLDLATSRPGQDVLKHARLTGLVPATDAEYEPFRRFTKQIVNERRDQK